MSLHQRWILQFHWISSFNPFTFSSLKVNTRIPFTVPFLCDNITSQTEFFVHGPNICLSFALFLTRRPHLGKFWLQILTDSHIDIWLFDWSYNKQLATRLVSWEYIGNLRRVRDQSDLEALDGQKDGLWLRLFEAMVRRDKIVSWRKLHLFYTGVISTK